MHNGHTVTTKKKTIKKTAGKSAGKELRSTPIRSELDVVVISIRRHGGEIIFNPSGDCRIETGDILIAIGRSDSLTKLNQLARGMI